jgi:hypothetical protein
MGEPSQQKQDRIGRRGKKKDERHCIAREETLFKLIESDIIGTCNGNGGIVVLDLAVVSVKKRIEQNLGTDLVLGNLCLENGAESSNGERGESHAVQEGHRTNRNMQTKCLKKPNADVRTLRTDPKLSPGRWKNSQNYLKPET